MHILCFESGGTKLVAAVSDAHGRLHDITVASRPSAQTASGTLDQLSEMGTRILAGRPPAAVGFGFGGTVRRSDRRPTHCFHEDGWADIDAVSTLEARFGAPVLIENDCKMAALAEAWHAGAKAPPSGALLYVTIGTGIGAGLTRDGRLVEIGDFGEAELGHVVVEPDGIACGCGGRGCLEAYCSGPGLSALALQSSGRQTDAAALMETFRRGDGEAGRVVDQAARYLGAVLGAAVSLLAPQRIVLGGGVMTNNQAFLEKIRGETKKAAFAPFWSNVREFRLSRLGENVVCQGAAIYVLQRRGKRGPSA